jgi:UDP-2,4-diacetamido-2,4,6-trideoxy-beta-L-altropyranose hydrolase
LVEIVFRCDSSTTIGGGHLVRCLALAEAFVERRCTVRFFASNETFSANPTLLTRFPGSLGGLAADGSDSYRLQQLLRQPVDLFILDSYLIGEGFEQMAIQLASRLLVIDDAPNRRHFCTHLVDATYGRCAGIYRPLVPESAMLLCGVDYATVRKPFVLLRPPTPLHPLQHLGTPRILVSIGLTDNLNGTSYVLRDLMPCRDSLHVDVALGASAPHAQEVRALVHQGGNGWQFLGELSSEGMARAMLQADIIIGAPGGSSYERCCLGKPALLIQIADNQKDNAAAMAALGAARVAGLLNAMKPGYLLQLLLEMIADPAGLAAMAAAAWRVTDGHGCGRVVAAVLS